MLARERRYYRSTGGQHRNLYGSAARRDPEDRPMRSNLRIVVTIKINPATVLLRLAAVLAILV